jgi:hypothetical protein
VSRPLRVLHCPSLVGGNAAQLARAEREVGLDSRCVALTGSPYDYDADEILVPHGSGFWRRELARWRLLARALRWADVVHFNFGSTILSRQAYAAGVLPGPGGRALTHVYRAYGRLLGVRDMALLRKAGKVLAMTYQGSDARQRDVSLERFAITAAGEVDDAYYPPGSDAEKRSEIAGVDRHADLIYALNPDLLHVLPERARFLPYANVDPQALTPRPAPITLNPPILVHAPTHRGVKGTRFLLEALDRLRSEGVRFELRLIEKVDHREVREQVATADLLVDQLLVGWYGGVATEAMALGRPVLAYIREEDLSPLPAELRAELPVISADPMTVESVLREWLTFRREELPALGARSRRYVKRWHDPRRIASELKADYEAAFDARASASSTMCS